MIACVVLPGALSAQIANAARAAFPHECCGLLEGRRDGDRSEIVAVHPTHNLSNVPDRFEIDPAEQFRLLRASRARATEIIGCYHSHPKGRPEPSAHDLEGASENRFVWLIAALIETGPPALRAFVFAEGSFYSVELAAA